MDSSFGKRILSAAWFLPLFLGLLALGPWPFAALLIVIAWVGSRELSFLLRRLGWHAPSWLLLSAPVLLAISLAGWLGPSMPPLAFLAWGLALLWLLWPRTPDGPRGGPLAWGVHLLGAIYLGFLLSYLGLLREGPWAQGPPSGTGARWGFYALIVTWASDTGAYVVGRLLGRHPLWPQVSPAKTLEGAFGGTLLALVGALIFRQLLAPGLTVLQAGVLGILGAALAQVGDLIESRLKRKSGVKDSGRMIPGHGGVLDRFDSLIFSAPLFFYYLQAFAR